MCAREFSEETVHVKCGLDNENRIAILDERVRDQVQSIVNAIRQVHFHWPDAEEASQAPRRRLILGINCHLFRRHARERAQDRGGAAHRILIEVEAKFLGAPFLRSVVRCEAQNRLADWDIW